jgi:hypothetical protein
VVRAPFAAFEQKKSGGGIIRAAIICGALMLPISAANAASPCDHFNVLRFNPITGAKPVASSLGLSGPHPTLPRLRGRVGWGMAQCPIIGMAGTSPTMTRWGCHELYPCYLIRPDLATRNSGVGSEKVQW